MSKLGMDPTWDPYGFHLQTNVPKLRREKVRLEKLAKNNHLRCPDCELLQCRNPYEDMLEAISERLAQLGDKPIKFRAYLVKMYGKLIALWAKS